MAGNPLMNLLTGNNPIMQMANMLRSGGNPSALFNQISQSNPQLQQISQMVNGKSPAQLGEMMRNLAKEKNMDLGQLAQQVGMPADIATKYGIEIKQDQTNNA